MTIRDNSTATPVNKQTLLQSIVLVKAIQCDIQPDTFPQTAIDEMARLILQTGGLINPLILRRTAPYADSYRLENQADALSYYGALRAKEIDLRYGETINALIITDDNEAGLLAQVNAFRAQPEPTPQSQTESDMLETFRKLSSAEQISIMYAMQKAIQLEKLTEEVAQLKAAIAN